MSNWVKNSFVDTTFSRDELYILFLAVGFGVCVLTHSFYLRKFKWKPVRIATDIAAICLIFQSLCYIYVSLKICTLQEQAIVGDFFANVVFGVPIQICDNFMTFSRYSAVVGGISRMHKFICFVWVVSISMIWPLWYWLFPIFADVNSPSWSKANLIQNLSWYLPGYYLYDIFYLTLLVRFLLIAEEKHVQSSINVSVYRIFAAKAIGHTLVSMTSVAIFYCDYPVGILVQGLFAVFGIHFFLNWNNSHEFFCGRKHAFRSKNTVINVSSGAGSARLIKFKSASNRVATSN